MVSALLNQNSHSPKRFTDFHSHQHGLDQKFGQIESSRKKSTETLCVPHLFIHYKHSHIRVGCTSPPEQGDLCCRGLLPSPTCIYFSRHPSKIRTVFLNRTQYTTSCFKNGPFLNVVRYPVKVEAPPAVSFFVLFPCLFFTVGYRAYRKKGKALKGYSYKMKNCPFSSSLMLSILSNVERVILYGLNKYIRLEV